MVAAMARHRVVVLPGQVCAADASPSIATSEYADGISESELPFITSLKSPKERGSRCLRLSYVAGVDGYDEAAKRLRRLILDVCVENPDTGHQLQPRNTKGYCSKLELNWGRNVVFGGAPVEPTSLKELQETVCSAAAPIRVVGRGH